MKRKTWLFVVAALGLVGLSRGQDKSPPSNYEHLKGLDWLIGEHTSQWTAEEDQGPVKKGDKLTNVVSHTWALNKNAIAVSAKLRTPSGTVNESAGLIGWDSAARRVVSFGFGSAGGHGTTSWSFKDGKWYRQARGSNPEGKPFTGTIVFSEITKDSFVAQTIDRTEGREKLPDGEKHTYRRVK